MIRRPPEILITTPESLHLMVSSNGGRSMLGRIRTVILDEIHAVVATSGDPCSFQPWIGWCPFAVNSSV